VPTTPKAKIGLGATFIQHETPGQSINDIINMLPGVSFQNNDPYGSASGTLSIRGFDGSRVSQMCDGFDRGVQPRDDAVPKRSAAARRDGYRAAEARLLLQSDPQPGLRRISRPVLRQHGDVHPGVRVPCFKRD
jgi:hypothetical protein